MTPIVQLNNQPIPFQPGVRKDTSLVMAVLSNKENGIDTSALDSKAVSNLLVKLPDNIRLALIDAVVRNGRLNDINASKQELQKIANALITKDENQFGLDSDSKLIVGVSGSEETIDGIDEVNGAVKNDAILADVAADKYDEFSKSMIEIQASTAGTALADGVPASPADTPEDDKILTPVLSLQKFVEKAKNLTDTITFAELPKEIRGLFLGNEDISDTAKVEMLRMLAIAGYFGDSTDYEGDLMGVFKNGGQDVSISWAGGPAFRSEFFKPRADGTLPHVDTNSLIKAVNAMCRSFESAKMRGSTVNFEKFSKDFISASAYSITRRSTNSTAAADHLARQFSSGGHAVTGQQMTQLAADFAKETLPLPPTAPPLKLFGRGVQLVLKGEELKLSVQGDDQNYYEVVSFKKADWDKFLAFMTEKQEKHPDLAPDKKKLFFLNILEMLSQGGLNEMTIYKGDEVKETEDIRTKLTEDTNKAWTWLGENLQAIIPDQTVLPADFFAISIDEPYLKKVEAKDYQITDVLKFTVSGAGIERKYSVTIDSSSYEISEAVAAQFLRMIKLKCLVLNSGKLIEAFKEKLQQITDSEEITINEGVVSLAGFILEPVGAENIKVTIGEASFIVPKKVGDPEKEFSEILQTTMLVRKAELLIKQSARVEGIKLDTSATNLTSVTIGDVIISENEDKFSLKVGDKEVTIDANKMNQLIEVANGRNGFIDICQQISESTVANISAYRDVLENITDNGNYFYEVLQANPNKTFIELLLEKCILTPQEVVSRLIVDYLKSDEGMKAKIKVILDRVLASCPEKYYISDKMRIKDGNASKVKDIVSSSLARNVATLCLIYDDKIMGKTVEDATTFGDILGWIFLEKKEQ